MLQKPEPIGASRPQLSCCAPDVTFLGCAHIAVTQYSLDYQIIDAQLL